MRIFYVDLLYDYGVKERGINAIGQDGFLSSLISLGHQVDTFYYDGLLHSKDELQQTLLAKADESKPDLIFFCLFQEQFEPATLLQLKAKYTTLNWFGDDQWRFNDFTAKYCNAFTYCITTDQFSVEKYQALGQHNVILSQWAAINKHCTPQFKKYSYDVSFVGGANSYRKWFVKKLAKLGVHVETFGHGWENGPIISEDMNKLFVSSKINLNISNSISCDYRYILSSRHALKEFLTSKKSSSQIKARNFEIPYFNGFQLTDYVPTLESYLDIGSEVVCYATVEEAAAQIKYYLNNNLQRENIKSAGHLKSQSKHGYFNRIEDILRKMF